MSPATSARGTAGFTLIELMVALVLGLLLIAAIGTIFVGSSRSYREDTRHAHMQDELRYAMAALVYDLEMAGHWAQLFDPSAIRVDGTLAEPGCSPAGIPRWAYAERGALTALDNATRTSAATAFPCIAGAELLAGADIVAIKRVAARPRATPTGAFLRTNGVVGSLFAGTAPQDAASAVPAPFQDWPYQPAIYYLRNFSVQGDGIPTLCRKELQGDSPRFVSDCLAEGIEDLQLEYGIDVDGNGSPNLFLSQPTPAQLARVVSVRVSLLARSVEPLPFYSNDKVYRLGNAPPRMPGDGFYRRALQTTVHIRNPASLRRLLG